MEIHAFAALGPREELRPFTYEVSPLEPFEILVKVSHCGLCSSDIHLINDDWKSSIYPLVPGHEVIGTIVKKGDGIDALKVGQRIGVGWLHSACMHCAPCLEGDTNVCLQKKATCNGHYGGFADHLIADGRFAFPIPDGLDSAHAAPLLCAGATVYAPLRRYNIQGAHSVAVIGIGGLGHLALQFASAFGCEVSAISHSSAKEAEAKSFGAHHFLTLKNPPKPAQFDFILSTVDVVLDWNLIITLLKPKGILCFVGRPQSQAQIEIGNLVSTQKSICGSSTSNRSLMNEMLSFAARHKIKPKIEHLPLKEVNQGIERLKANAVRYRIVLEV